MREAPLGSPASRSSDDAAPRGDRESHWPHADGGRSRPRREKRSMTRLWRCVRAIGAVVLLLLVADCSDSNPENAIRGFWEPPADWWRAAAESGGSLRRQDGTVFALSRDVARNLHSARNDIRAASGVDFGFLIADWNVPNAFAEDDRGRHVVVFSTSLISMIGRDPDAVASVMGHEVAHHKLGHVGGGRAERERNTWVASQVLGTIAGMIVPFSGYVVGPAVTGVGRSFTRDEERDADALGQDWTIAAGHDPCGAYRMAAAFARLARDPMDIPFLSTHPGHEERMASADALSLKRHGRRCAEARR